jgi:hypothetical protein
MMLLASCSGTSWPETVALCAFFFALAAAFIVYRLTRR